MTDAPPGNAPPGFHTDSSDVIRLILHHLTESGLHGSAAALRQESGVGLAGVVHRSGAAALRSWARQGDWGGVLGCLEGIDPGAGAAAPDNGDVEDLGKGRFSLPAGLIADVHEMAALELADAGETALAYAVLRMCEDDLDGIGSADAGHGDGDGDRNRARAGAERRSASVERRIAALTSLRALHAPNPNSGAKDVTARLLPPDYYGAGGVSRQRRRDSIGGALADAVPAVPPDRLLSLIQQALKWQAHTGKLPQVRDLWEQGDGDGDALAQGGKDRKRGRKRRKRFDLVLGEVDASAVPSGDGSSSSAAATTSAAANRVPRSPYSKIKFGKGSYVECAAFLPDGMGLVTGSSDGFVEVWDPAARYEELRVDLPYQKSDELLLHDAPVLSIAISNDGSMMATGSSDGTVKVWKIADGRCLRRFDAAHRGAVSCLALSAGASHVLTGGHDGACREFGMRASRMLKEFCGHSSYVNSCAYVTTADGVGRGGKEEGRASEGLARSKLLVVTGSADGTVRVWDGRSAESLRVMRLATVRSTAIGASLVAAPTADEAVAGRPVHSVVPLHTPPGCLVIVSRSPVAFLVNLSGTVLRTFERDDTKADDVRNASSATDKADFVAATASPNNKWLYVATEDGLLLCYDIATGRIEKTIRDFAEETTGKSDASAEIVGLTHHVHKSILGGYSNSTGQRRGRLTLWK